MTTMEDAAAYEVLEELITPLPIAEYHEDMGSVLWWCWEPPKPFEQISERVVSSAHNGKWLGEPPYVGSPLDLGREVLVTTTIETATEVPAPIAPDDGQLRVMIGGWPGYHTHFTPIPKVKAP